MFFRKISYGFFAKGPQTLYEIMDVSKTASPAQIKQKYFEQVKKYHPDHNSSPDAEAKFKEIVKAYTTLRDPIKRQLYDSDSQHYEQAGTGFTANGPESSYYADPKEKREFYQNRWYGYQKPNYETLHDEFQKQYKFYIIRYEFVDQEGFKAIAKRALIIIFLYALWDGYRIYSRRRHSQFIETSREILEAQYKTNEIDQYIEERQESHQYE